MLNIKSMCDKVYHDKGPPLEIYTRLKKFYSLPELHRKQKQNSTLSIYGQLYSPIPQPTLQHTNRYSTLDNFYDITTMDVSNVISNNTDQASANAATANTITPATKTNEETAIQQDTLRVNDTGIARLSEVIFNQVEIDRQNREANGDAPDVSVP